jgi:hypothetical protein
VGKYFLGFMCLKTVLTTLNQLSQVQTPLTSVQEVTKMSTLQKNIWIGPNELALYTDEKKYSPIILVTYPGGSAQSQPS